MTGFADRVNARGTTLPYELIDGVPTTLNRMMAESQLDVSVISAVEYARDAKKYAQLVKISGATAD